MKCYWCPELGCCSVLAPPFDAAGTVETAEAVETVEAVVAVEAVEAVGVAEIAGLAGTALCLGRGEDLLSFRAAH